MLSRFPYAPSCKHSLLAFFAPSGPHFGLFISAKEQPLICPTKLISRMYFALNLNCISLFRLWAFLLVLVNDVRFHVMLTEGPSLGATPPPFCGWAGCDSGMKAANAPQSASQEYFAIIFKFASGAHQFLVHQCRTGAGSRPISCQ